MVTSLSLPNANLQHQPPAAVLSGHRRTDAIRARAGAAYARLQASGSALADALGVHHTVIVRRKQGMGGLANVLLEVDAMERQRIDTTPLLEALMSTQIEARPTDQLSLPMLMGCEQEDDSAEDQAQIAFLTGTGSLDDWCAKLRTYVARATLTLRVAGGAR